MAEFFDLYDEQGRALGRAKRREDVHRDGDWHRSAHVWIFTSDGKMLLQRRALSKDTWPGYLDVSVGGHYHAGEGPDGVLREAREELGIVVAADDLIALGVRRVDSREPGIIDRELQDVYLLRRDSPLAAYHPDPDEIAALVLIDAEDALRLHRGTIDGVDVELLPAGASATQHVRVSARDLPVLPGREEYVGALVSAIRAVLSGRPPRPLSAGTIDLPVRNK